MVFRDRNFSKALGAGEGCVGHFKDFAGFRVWDCWVRRGLGALKLV